MDQVNCGPTLGSGEVIRLYLFVGGIQSTGGSAESTTPSLKYTWDESSENFLQHHAYLFL